MKWLLCFGLCIINLYNAYGQIDDALNNFTPIDQSVRISQSKNTTTQFLEYVPLTPITAYSNDFENERIDFFSNDFVISNLPGIDGQVLHTPSPYPKSSCIDSSCNLTAQLMHPVILNKRSIIKFDEIVLVEPESISIGGDNKETYDYVMVEASKNQGETWYPLTERYNAENDEVWKHLFSKSIFNAQSYASGSQSIFKEKSINLTDNINFFEGDTIHIRFRLSSDYSINGWGWAIDNVEIQHDVAIAIDESRFYESFIIFPNPCQDQIYIECTNKYGPSVVDIIIINQTGCIMHHENQISTQLIRNKHIDISELKSGVYTVIITDQAYFRKTKKIIKI